MATIEPEAYVEIKETKIREYAPQTSVEHEIKRMERIQTTNPNTYTFDISKPLFDIDPYIRKSRASLKIKRNPDNEIVFDNEVVQESELSQTKPTCDRVYIIMSDTNESETQEADRHFSWKCSSCWHKGTKWISRKSLFRNCPNCGNNNTTTFRIAQIEARGNCKSMWNGMKEETTPQIDWKRIRCGHCGERNRYLIKQPSKCAGCGHSLQTT